MKTWFWRLFQVRHEYADPTEYERARTLTAISLGLIGLTVLFGGVLLGAELFRPTEGGLDRLLLLLGVAMGAMLLTYALAQTGRVTLGGVVLVGALVLVNYMGEAGESVANNSALIAWVLPVIVAGLLVGARASLAVATLNMILLGSLALAEWQSTAQVRRASLEGDLAFSFSLTGVVFYTVTFINWLFIGRVQQRAREAFRRADQLRATAEVSQAAATMRDLSTLLNDTVELISRAFGFYHVQIFLVDEQKQYAWLRASTGEVGRQLLARRHRLPVGSQSVIGQVTARGEPVVASDVSSDPVHRRNELLPSTRSEMALPLRAGGQVIGALDVQSVEADVFSDEDVETLQVMANQLATAIENVRLLDEVTARAAENERLLEEAQANLREIEALNRSLTRQGWREYLRSRTRRESFGYTLQGDEVAVDARWTSSMRAAYEEQRVVVADGENGGQSSTIALPLRVRGEVIGVVEVERDRQWSEDDLELVEALGERLSLALDNSRLLEQADTLARREQMVNEITHNVQQAASVDDVLQAALVELGRVLGASRGVVQLSPKDDTGSAPGSQRRGDESRRPVSGGGVVSEEKRA